MVITSDNTATDLSIAKVGGVAKVNAWLKQNGYADQKLTQTTGDLFAKYNALTPTDDRNAKTNADKSYWLGEITPKGMGLMFEGIEKKTIASAASCDAMLRMLRAQQAGARRLNHFITGRRRAQDRRLPTGAGQRRRHHLRAVRTNRRVVPRQRDHRQLRRSRRSDRPRRATNRGVFRQMTSDSEGGNFVFENVDSVSLCLCGFVVSVGARTAALARREIRRRDSNDQASAWP